MVAGGSCDLPTSGGKVGESLTSDSRSGSWKPRATNLALCSPVGLTEQTHLDVTNCCP